MIRNVLKFTAVAPAALATALAGPVAAQAVNKDARALARALEDPARPVLEGAFCEEVRGQRGCDALAEVLLKLSIEQCGDASGACVGYEELIAAVGETGEVPETLLALGDVTPVEAEAPAEDVAEIEEALPEDSEESPEAEAEADAAAETEAAEVEVEAEAEVEADVAEAEAEAEPEPEMAESEPQPEAAEEEVAEEQRSTVSERLETAIMSEAAAALRGEDEPEAVDTEVTQETEETARSSDQDMAAADAEPATAATEQAQASNNDDNDDRLRAILGGAAAGFLLGKILDNGDEVVEQTNDRVVVLRDGEYFVRKDENELLRRPGTEVESQTYGDGSTKTTVTRSDGVEIVTLRDPNGEIIYRVRVNTDGSEVVLIDELLQPPEPVEVAELPEPEEEVIEYRDTADLSALIAALEEERYQPERGYSLRQVRENRELRELMPRVDLDAITFATGSAAITQSQAESLVQLGRAMSALIEEDPDEIFLIEGHTDSVGSEITNLALSDRRAESVALALTEYFDVPPENLIVQGYGERFLKIPVEGDIRENRRAAVRRITPLLRTTARN